jgi:hypothetical protein
MSPATRTNGNGVDPFQETDASEFLEGLAAEGKNYLEAQKKYYALLASERAGRMAGGVVSRVVMAVLLGSVLLFVNLAAALWLGDLLQSRALGFLVVGGFYLLVFLVLMWWWRSGGRDRFSLNIINELYHGQD